MKKLFLLVAVASMACVLSAQTVVFSDDFDSYTAGSLFVQQAAETPWTTWSNAPGTAEDAYITADYASSAPNSLKISGTSDIIYPFANYTTGAYNLDFDYYVPSSGAGAYFNVQHYSAPGTQWAFECFFTNAGAGELHIGGQTMNFTCPQDDWFHVLVSVQLDDDNIQITIDGSEVCDVPFHYQSDIVNGICQLGAVNFFAGAPGNASGTYYVDNFTVTEVAAAAAGHIAVSPETAIEAEINCQQGGNTALTLSNTGDAPVEYRVVPTYTVDLSDASTTDPVELSYYLSESEYLTYNSDAQWEVGIGFPAGDIQEYIGKHITQVSVLLYDSILTDTKVRIYKMGGMIAPGPGEMVYEQAFDAVDGWNIIELTTPYHIDGGDFWIAVYINQPAGGGGVYVDDAAANYYSNWIKNGPSWKRLSDVTPTLNYSWCMKAVIAGNTYTPWLTLTPDEGQLAAGANQEVNVAVAPAGEQMQKSAEIAVISTDFDNPMVTVDVNINFTNVGIDENGIIHVSVYPNPVSDLIQVEGTQLSRVEVYGCDGRLVYACNVSGGSAAVNASAFAAGPYMVKVFAGDKVEVHKIVKK